MITATMKKSKYIQLCRCLSPQKNIGIKTKPPENY